MACGSSEVVGQTATMGSSGGVRNLPQHPQEQMQSKPLGASTVLSLPAQGSYPPTLDYQAFQEILGARMGSVYCN